MLNPFTPVSTYRSFDLFPFFAYYERTTFETVSHALELMLLYLPLVFRLRG